MNMITQINNPLNHPFKKMVKPLYRFAIAIMVPGLMLSATASAQDRTLPLDEAVKLGIQNSKVLTLSQSIIDQAVSKYKQAKDEVLPTGSASYAYDVINSFYNLYIVLLSKKVVEQNLKSIDEQIHQSQRFFDQGLVTKNDVLRFQLQRSNVELNGIDLESNRKIIYYDLDI